MAIVKFVTSGCPMNNIFPYIMREEAAEDKLVDGINCSPETALEEFKFTKRQFHKEDGRMYYHIVQSFSPEDNLTPEVAHEIGMRFAESFPSYQIVVATHTNRDHIHNHLVMNSVNCENGKKFHQTRDELLAVKEYSNKLCREYGLSVTESKANSRARWKRDLVQTALDALEWSYTKDDFIEYMNEHGYEVKWEDNLKYITFATPEGYKIRDNKLLDERFLKDNLELYFAMGGTEGVLADTYQEYSIPKLPHNTFTGSNGLLNLIGDFLSVSPPRHEYTPQMINEINQAEKLRLEKILGRKISPAAFACYCTQEEYEQANGLGMIW